MRVGFVGLGSMGSGMARNLLKAGHELIVYNRTRKRAEALESDGAKIANNPAEAAEAGVILTMLADDSAVEQVIFGDHGILSSSKNILHVSMSTISIELARRLESAHAEKQQHYISAPVFGRPDAAAQGKLVIVAAGPTADVEESRPLFEAIGQKIFIAGDEPWKANIIKLGGNFTIASMIETLGEGMALMRKSGIDPKLFLEIINGNVMRSPVYENYGNIIAEERFEPAGFKMRLGLKDIRLVLAAAESLPMPLPLASLMRDQFLTGLAHGYGDIDWSGLARVAADQSGLTEER